MLQMDTAALETNLHKSRKIVNDSNTSVLWDLSGFYCNCYL